MTYRMPRLGALDDSARARFQRDGFLIVENFLNQQQIAALRDSFPKLFAGKFDTGIYPDEWYWREGMSLPDVTRHMANAWKSDLSVAKLALAEDIGRAATLLSGWPGVRLGQDTIWWKPPQTKAVTFHQDSSFMDFLNPPKTITCWVTLDQTATDAGTLEYVPGSHLWPLTPIPEGFHAPDDYRGLMKRAAREAGVENPEPILCRRAGGLLRVSCRRDLARFRAERDRRPDAPIDRRPYGSGRCAVFRPPWRLHLPALSAHRGSLARRELLPDIVDERWTPYRLDRDLLRHGPPTAGTVSRRRVKAAKDATRLSDRGRLAISTGR